MAKFGEETVDEAVRVCRDGIANRQSYEEVIKLLPVKFGEIAPLKPGGVKIIFEKLI